MEGVTRDEERCCACLCLLLANPAHFESEEESAAGGGPVLVSRCTLKSAVAISPFLKVSLSSQLLLASRQTSFSLVACDPCRKFISSVIVSASRHACKKKRKQAKKHPVHIVAEHVISGGISKPTPSRPQIKKCLSVLDPRNPVLYRLFDGLFLERYEAAKAIEATPSDETFGLVRWLFEGAQSVFSDAGFAKIIRRAISKYPDPFWARLPPACRHCAASSSFSTSANCKSYCAAVSFAGSGETMLASLNSIEQGPLVQGVTFLCTKCRNVSAISYEYDTALRTALLLPDARKTDCEHYSRLVAAYHAER